MDQEFKDQERIYQYLQGNLAGAALKQFQADLKDNAALKAELSFSKAMMVTLQNKEALAVNQQLKKVIASKSIEPDFDALKEFEVADNSISLNEVAPTIKNKSWNKGLLGGLLGIGLLALLIPILLGIWQPFTSNETINPLISSHLIPFENVISANATTNPLLEKGMTAYTNSDYTAAIPQLQSYLQNNKDPNVRFYLGLSHLLNLESEKAIPILERTVDTSTSPILEVAKWYLALAYIDAQQIPAAKVTLMELQSLKEYEARATKLLNALAHQTIQ